MIPLQRFISRTAGDMSASIATWDRGPATAVRSDLVTKSVWELRPAFAHATISVDPCSVSACDLLSLLTSARDERRRGQAFDGGHADQDDQAGAAATTTSSSSVVLAGETVDVDAAAPPRAT